MTEPKKTIYAFVTGEGPFGVMSMAVAEDGKVLAEHASSSVEWCKHDIGATSTWHHKAYGEHYPDGFEVVWVDDPSTDARLVEVKRRNQERSE